MWGDLRIGDTIRIADWRVRRYNDGLPLTLPAIVLTLTPELVRRELARQRAWQRSPAKKKPARKRTGVQRAMTAAELALRASVPRPSTR